MLTTFLPKTTFKNKTIVDITKGIRVSDIVGNQVYSFQNYVINGDERPEHVAYNYYDNSNLAWLVMLPNVKLDPYYEWPLSQRDFESWLKKKYGSLETAQSTILFYEHSSKNITISPDTYNHNTTLTYITGGDYSQVDAYTYYDRVNENKRTIKLIDRGYLVSILGQIQSVFSNGN
jgi:hypothetical protein